MVEGPVNLNIDYINRVMGVIMDLKHLSEAQAVLREAHFNDSLTPWISETAKALSEGHDHWSDYAGWERWMSQKLTKGCIESMCSPTSLCGPCATYVWWEEMPGDIKANLYALMSDGFDEVAVASKE